MSDSVKSIEKMFHILSCFSLDQRDLSISEIQTKTGYPKSTIFRILETMLKMEYIQRNEDNHRYSLGFKFFHLGSIVLNSFDYRKVCIPYMEELASKTNETIDINIVSGNERLCIEKVDSPETVRSFVRIGERNPLHQGASGKTLLAFLPENRQKEYFAQQNLSHDQLMNIKREIITIQSKGFCITKQERVEGSYSISAPIFDHTNQAIVGLTISGPIQRLVEADREEFLIKQLLETTSNVSSKLGYFGGITIRK